jgi:hypothetical protein
VPLQRAVGEVVRDVRLRVDVRLVLARERQQLSPESKCRASHLVVIGSGDR